MTLPPATINNAYFKFSQVMPLEFPINTFRTTTTRNIRFFNFPPPVEHTIIHSALCFAFFVVSDLVHKKIRNSIYKHVIEKVNTYTHTHTHTDGHNKVKHVGICFLPFNGEFRFTWSLCVSHCTCVRVRVSVCCLRKERH